MPEPPCFSTGHMWWDEESLHSSILDSTHARDSIGTLQNRHSIGRTTMNKSTGSTKRFGVIRSGCHFFRFKFRGWKSRKRTKPKLVLVSEKCTDDTKSPLLNPNAIHERRSLNILTIDEDWIYDDEQEKMMQTLSTRDAASSSSSPLSLSPGSTPLIRVLSPSFARHPRQWNDCDIGAFASFVKKAASPSNDQLLLSNSSLS